jgi:hypothetical protein
MLRTRDPGADPRSEDSQQDRHSANASHGKRPPPEDLCPPENEAAPEEHAAGQLARGRYGQDEHNRKDHAHRAIENSCAPADKHGEQGEHGDDQAAGGAPRVRRQQRR